MAKVTQIGDDLGLVLPKAELEALGWKPGDEVLVQRRGKHLELIPVASAPGVRPAVQSALSRTLGKFDEALDELSR